MAKINLETLDEYANKAEDALAIGSLGSMAATAAFPNPVTAGTSLAMNIGSGLIDGYQLARAIYNKDSAGAMKNIFELLLSAIGAKAFKNAKDISKKVGTTKTFTVGRRPKTKHKVTTTVSKYDAYPSIVLGSAANIGSDISSLSDNYFEHKNKRTLENGGK